MALISKLRIFFAALFLIGAAAGAGAMRAYDLSTTPLRTFLSSVADPDGIAQRMLQRDTDRYHLTPAEVARITPLVQEMTQRIYAQRAQFGTQVMGLMDSYHEQIGQELTPEHRDAYAQHWSERRKDFAALLLIKSADPAPARP